MDGPRIEVASDVVGFLTEQHGQMQRLFEDVLAARGKVRSYAFYKLRRLLAVHETAEEEIVHPMARRALPDGDNLVATCLHEERDTKVALSELEKLEVDGAEFEQKLLRLREAVLRHMQLEEEEEFPQLTLLIDPARLEQMRRAVEFAEAVAPTRPHPVLTRRSAHVVAGPVVAIVDRVRDVVAGKV